MRIAHRRDPAREVAPPARASSRTSRSISVSLKERSALEQLQNARRRNASLGTGLDGKGVSRILRTFRASPRRCTPVRPVAIVRRDASALAADLSLSSSVPPRKHVRIRHDGRCRGAPQDVDFDACVAVTSNNGPSRRRAESSRSVLLRMRGAVHTASANPCAPSHRFRSSHYTNRPARPDARGEQLRTQMIAGGPSPWSCPVLLRPLLNRACRRWPRARCPSMAPSAMKPNPMVGGAPMYANKNHRRQRRELERSHDRSSRW